MTNPDNPQNQPPQGGQQSSPPLSKREARANAASAKAYQKGQRNWFMRHKILSVIGVVIIVGILATAFGGGGSDGASNNASKKASDNAAVTTSAATGSAAPSSESAPAPTTEAAPAAPGVGTPVSDGDFEFTVTKVDPGVSEIGTSPLTKKAQGKFVLVYMTVKNNGNSQAFFDVTAQKMMDQQGRELTADAGAGIYVDPNDVLAQINPGNTVKGILVYDIPADSVPTSIKVHDSFLSGGATIKLS